MFCQECGSKIADNAKFCPSCGAKTAVADAPKRKTVKKIKQDGPPPQTGVRPYPASTPIQLPDVREKSTATVKKERVVLSKIDPKTTERSIHILILAVVALILLLALPWVWVVGGGINAQFDSNLEVKRATGEPEIDNLFTGRYGYWAEIVEKNIWMSAMALLVIIGSAIMLAISLSETAKGTYLPRTRVIMVVLSSVFLLPASLLTFYSGKWVGAIVFRETVALFTGSEKQLAMPIAPLIVFFLGIWLTVILLESMKKEIKNLEKVTNNKERKNPHPVKRRISELTGTVGKYACLVAVIGLIMIPILPLIGIEEPMAEKEYVVYYDLEKNPEDLAYSLSVITTGDDEEFLGIQRVDPLSGDVLSERYMFDLETMSERDGNLFWIELYEGEVYMVEYKHKEDEDGLILILSKLNLWGKEIWQTQFDHDANSFYQIQDFQMKFSGDEVHIFTVRSREEQGTGHLSRFDTSGNLLRYENFSLEQDYRKIVYDITGRCLYVYRDTYSGDYYSSEYGFYQPYYPIIDKISLDGSVLWNTSFEDVSTRHLNALSVGDKTYVSGVTGSDGEVFVSKYDSAGILEWNKKWRSGSSYNNMIFNSGGLYVWGIRENGTEAYVLGYNQNGDLLWHRTFESEKYSSDSTSNPKFAYTWVEPYKDDIILLLILEEGNKQQWEFVYLSNQGTEIWRTYESNGNLISLEAAFFVGKNPLSGILNDAWNSVWGIAGSLLASLATSILLLIALATYYLDSDNKKLYAFNKAVFLLAGPVILVSSIIGLYAHMNLLDVSSIIVPSAVGSSSFAWNYAPGIALLALLVIGLLLTHFVTRLFIFNISKARDEQSEEELPSAPLPEPSFEDEPPYFDDLLSESDLEDEEIPEVMTEDELDEMFIEGQITEEEYDKRLKELKRSSSD